ncbi:MAG: DNA methyltransferase [Ignavibacteria bacterium]|jgi:site-specific DNA-methyltransferase (adenine-specific)
MTSYQLKTQTIYCGDNLKMLTDIPDESIDLCYIDPPFNSNRNYEVFWGDVQEKRAFNDRFGDAQEYINYMRPRVQEIYRVLKKTGSFYYHCDWHASHYVKIMLDQIFGFNFFQNEIYWKRTFNTGSSKSIAKKFPVSTDSIFYYSKSNDFTFNKLFRPYSDGALKRYDKVDEKGRFMWVPLKTVSQERLNLLRKSGEIREGPDLKYPRYKKYFDDTKGSSVDNIWDDIGQLATRGDDEKLGYPTQKPIALMERIIEASSNKGDVILDAFCGCGTTLVASQKLNRKWIGIDISPTACRVMSQRLYDLYKLREGKDFYVEDLPKTEEELRLIPHFEFQNWAVIALGQLTNMSGIPNKIKSGDFGIDGRLYPVELEKTKKEGKDLFGDTDKYYPVQVKQMDKVGRPDIDNFYAAIKRDGRTKGYFVSFAFSKDAETEVKRLWKEGEIDINLITVSSLLKAEAYKK